MGQWRGERAGSVGWVRGRVSPTGALSGNRGITVVRTLQVRDKGAGLEGRVSPKVLRVNP